MTAESRAELAPDMVEAAAAELATAELLAEVAPGTVEAGSMV